jgi:hypothetical protein
MITYPTLGNPRKQSICIKGRPENHSTVPVVEKSQDSTQVIHGLMILIIILTTALASQENTQLHQAIAAFRSWKELHDSLMQGTRQYNFDPWSRRCFRQGILLVWYISPTTTKFR